MKRTKEDPAHGLNPGGAATAARPLPEQDPAKILEGLPDKVRQLHDEIGKVVFGQSAAVDGVLYALLSRGHCLFVGVPGVAS
jgi:MoxR-like ATPase